MMLVQSVVNSFGSEALAGFSAAMRIEAICVVPMSGIGNAMSSYTAQNIGADKYSRVGEGYRAANKLVLICAAVILVVLELFNRQLIEIFLGADGTATAVSTDATILYLWDFSSVSLDLKWLSTVFSEEPAI